MTKRFAFLFSVMMLIMTMVACGGSSAPPAPKGLSQQLKIAYIEGASVYEDLVGDESLISGNYRVWQEDFSKLIAGAGDQAFIMNNCYQNFNEAIPAAAAAVFGQTGENNPITSEQQNEAFFNALVSSNFYAGNIELCQQAGMDIMEYLRVQRDANFGLRTLVIDQFRSYDLSQRSNPKIATVMHFYNQYGPEIARLIENGEGYLLDQLAAENNLEPLPIDFIGFPTAALEVSVSDVSICQRYQRIYDGLDPAPGGRNPNLFLTEYDPVVGSCRLYRQAAYNYMDRLFVTQQAGRQLDCGTDAGAFGQLDENCQPVQPQQ